MRAIQIKDRENFNVILLRHNVDLHVKDVCGNSTIHLAAQFGSVNALLQLIDAGANVNECGEDGDRPIHAAAYQGRKDLLYVLYGAGASVNEVNDFDMNVLQMSTFNSIIHINIVNLLL